MIPSRTTIVLVIGSLLQVYVSSGCALWHRRCSAKAIQSVAIVDVGGQVHEPQSVEIGPTGLTLHRALLIGGGARDSLLTQTNTTVDPTNEANLLALAEASRDRGVLQFHIELFQEDEKGSDLAKIATPRTRAEADAEIKKKQEAIDGLQAALFQSLSIETVKNLHNYSRDAGKTQEKLRLFDELPSGFFDPDTVNDIQKKLDESIDGERRTILELNKSSARTWQQSARGELFVALDRPSSNPPIRYYFPYEMAISGLAGEIELRDGDAVEVIDVQNTELRLSGAQFFNDLRSISIQGAVQQSGVVNDLRTIGDVHRTNPRTIDDPRGVWMLVRPSEGGKGQRVFVLPDRMVGVNGAAANAEILDGDEFTYTILPQVPIVLESLVINTLRGVRRRHLDRFDIVEKHRQNKADRARTRQLVPGAAVVQRNLSPLAQ